MSKVYALSGIRAAYLCAPRHLARELINVTPPWAVSLVGQLAAVEALNDPNYYLDRHQQTRALRRDLIRELEQLDLIQPLPSATSFVLCHLAAGVAATDLVARCQKYGLFLRDVTSMASRPLMNAFRIAVKDAKTNSRMLNVIRDALKA